MNQASTPSDTFFGHPIGLRTLFLTEMWERMSYYGMRALLVLYMTGAVTGFNPGLGWTSLEAQAIYGIYVGMVYFVVIPGGWLADNILGHQKAVLIGAIIIMLGHFTLAIPVDQTFFLGLIFVVIGTGLLKGNISTIVGKLYSDDDDRRENGYYVFYMAINIGSTLGFLICSYLGERIGWHWGFGAAGIGMTFGVIQFIKTRHLLGIAGAEPNPMDDTRRSQLILWSTISLVLTSVVIITGLMGLYTINARAFAEGFYYFLSFVAGTYFLYLYFLAGLNAEEKKSVILLGLLFIGAAAFWSGFDQSASSLSIFARDYTDLSVSGYIIPIGWLQFANPIFVVIFAPVFAGIWTQLARKNLNPSLPIKFAFGLLLMALSFIVMLYAVELALVSSPVNMRWLILTYLIQTWGELALSPVGLAAFSRHSPKKYVGQMFGLWFTASAIGGVLAGLLGGDALVEGLASISPVFGFMVRYYVIIAIALIVVSFLIGKTRGGNMVKWIGFGAIIGTAVFQLAVKNNETVGFSWIISVVFAVALPLVLFVVSFLIGKTRGGKEGSGLMKKFLKLIFWFTAIPWILHIFKAGFSDIPRATNQKVGDFLYVAAWVFTFPLMMGFCAIYAFFSSIRWIFIHPYFIAPPETIDKWIDETIEDKKCQFCAEWIKGDALICRYCGSEC